MTKTETKVPRVVRNWGKSVGITIPSDWLKVGDIVILEKKEGKIVVQKVEVDAE